MTDEQIKKLQENGIKVPFVGENCIGCGACVAICPGVFDLNDEGKAIVKEDMDIEKTECCQDAMSACPVDIISYLD